MHNIVSKLLIYGNMPEDSILMELSNIIREYKGENYKKDEIITRIYHQIKRILEISTDYAFDKNLWHNYLTYLLITNENPFSLTCEMVGASDGSVNYFAKNDFKQFKKLFDYDFVQERCNFFYKEIDNDSMAQLLVMVLSEGDISAYIKHLGIDKEKEWQAKAMRAKKDNNSLTFGGKSIYGTLIDTACQRYGWTFEYVVWGISYANLQLLLADSVTSIYLSDEERKRVNIPQDRDIINADDPANMAKIKAMKWD